MPQLGHAVDALLVQPLNDRGLNGGMVAMSQDSGERQQARVTPAALLLIATHLVLARFPQLHDSLTGLVAAAAATGVDSRAAATGVDSCAGPPFLEGGHMLNLPDVVIQSDREAAGMAISKTVSFSPVGSTTAESCVCVVS